MSERGLVALAVHEGVVPKPYLDIMDVWTFGIGHTAAAGPPDPAVMDPSALSDEEQAIAEAFRLFRQTLARYEREVREAITVELEPHEFDALVSFHYNTGAIAKADLTKALNAGDRAAAAEGFLGWSKPAAIRPRREAEKRLFETGAYAEGPVCVWHVNADNRIDTSAPAREIAPDEALAYLAVGGRKGAVT